MVWFISWLGFVLKCYSWFLNVCGCKIMLVRLEKVNYSVIDEIFLFFIYVNVMGICFWSYYLLFNINSVCDLCMLIFYIM